jgi:hypothetical protein
MVSNTSFHSWRHAQTGVYPAEVIVREVQSARGLQVIQLLGVAKSQACKPFDRLPHGQILPFHIACRDVPHVWPAVADFYYCLYHGRRRIASSGVMLAVIAIYFYHLREVGLPCKNILNSLLVEVESVSGNLKAMLCRKSAPKRSQKVVRSFAVAFAHSVGGNQFRLGINRDEDPSIADLWRILSPYVALFLLYESPNFITLNALALQVFHLRFHQSYAAFSRENQQAENGVAVQPRDALCATHARAFYQELDCQQRFVFRHRHCAEQTDVIFCVGLAALRAPKPLEAISVFPKTLAFDAALLAIHIITLQQALAVCQVPKLPEKTTVTFVLRRGKPQTGGAI